MLFDFGCFFLFKKKLMETIYIRLFIVLYYHLSRFLFFFIHIWSRFIFDFSSLSIFVNVCFRILLYYCTEWKKQTFFFWLCFVILCVCVCHRQKIKSRRNRSFINIRKERSITITFIYTMTIMTFQMGTIKKKVFSLSLGSFLLWFGYFVFFSDINFKIIYTGVRIIISYIWPSC